MFDPTKLINERQQQVEKNQYQGKKAELEHRIIHHTRAHSQILTKTEDNLMKFPKNLTPRKKPVQTLNHDQGSALPQDSMKGVNNYWKQVSEEEMQKGVHRQRIGDMWDEIGQLQFNFLVEQGLLPYHTLLDVGCGCLRGGVYFVPYLENGHYFGMDINESLIEAGRIELEKINAQRKEAH